jgi:hypothetical protein
MDMIQPEVDQVRQEVLRRKSISRRSLEQSETRKVIYIYRDVGRETAEVSLTVAMPFLRSSLTPLSAIGVV